MTQASLLVRAALVLASLLAPLVILAQPAPAACAPGAAGSAGVADPVQAQQRAALGYSLVCEENLRRYDHIASAQPLAVAIARLAFKPVSLDDTPFREFEVIGGVPDLQGPAGAAVLHRLFRTAEGRVIDLREWDLSVLGGEVFSRRELQAQQVNGAPAQLVVAQASSGRAVSILSWVEGRRHYELSMDADVIAAPPFPSLQDLAASLPKSQPAAPGEADGCALPGQQLQWVTDYCMASLDTDDERAAAPCIHEESRTRFDSACVAKQHYKRELCKLLIDGGVVAGPIDRCARDPAFLGRIVENVRGK